MSQRPSRLLIALFAVALPLALGACSKSPQTESQNNTGTTAASEVKVTSVDLGKQVDGENHVTEKTDTFTPNDIIYASVLTDGAAPNTTLQATWTFQDGQVVSTSERSIAPDGAAATEFHIQKVEGFPAGKYKVVVSLNGNPVQTKEFEVKAS